MRDAKDEKEVNTGAFSAWLHALLTEREWSYRDLAARIPYDVALVSRWASGERAPTLEALAWLAAAATAQRPATLSDMDDQLPIAEACDGAGWRVTFTTIALAVLEQHGTKPRKAREEIA